jgi:hypothetical protein
MVNNKIDEAVFDTILTHAFSDVFLRELDNLYIDNKSEYYPTKKHKKAARRAFKLKMRRQTGIYIYARRAAAIILIMFSLGFGMMMATPSIRASVCDTVANFYDKYISFNFMNKSQNITLSEYTLGYMPDGFELTDKFETNLQNQYTFKKDDITIIFSYSDSSAYNIQYDNENTKVENFLINNQTAYILLSLDDSDIISIIWGDEKITFKLSGNINKEELIKIAEKVG